jgi:hypothetical protein
MKMSECNTGFSPLGHNLAWSDPRKQRNLDNSAVVLTSLKHNRKVAVGRSARLLGLCHVLRVSASELASVEQRFCGAMFRAVVVPA